MTTAYLIGETSGGMTAVEIRDDRGIFVWSCMWFGNGATADGYLSGLQTVIGAMLNADDWKEWEEGDREEDGRPVRYDVEYEGCTTGVICSYDTDTKEWTVEDDWRNYGQSGEIVEALMLAGIVEADDDFDADDVSRVGRKLIV
jgi:hypothetical protein